LAQFSKNLLTRTSELEKAVDSLVTETQMTHVRTSNVITEFLMLSNTQVHTRGPHPSANTCSAHPLHPTPPSQWFLHQFIENRVYEDDADTAAKAGNATATTTGACPRWHAHASACLPGPQPTRSPWPPWGGCAQRASPPRKKTKSAERLWPSLVKRCSWASRQAGVTLGLGKGGGQRQALLTFNPLRVGVGRFWRRTTKLLWRCPTSWTRRSLKRRSPGRCLLPAHSAAAMSPRWQSLRRRLGQAVAWRIRADLRNRGRPAMPIGRCPTSLGPRPLSTTRPEACATLWRHVHGSG
jgi:hypothetical protein